MAQYGAGCSIGDHLYPDGKMDAQTYENIGYAYDYHKRIEPFCYGGEFVTNLGVYMNQNDKALQGVIDVLLENQFDFDFVWDGGFDKFDTVIVPSGVQLKDGDRASLDAFLKGGGKLLLIGSAFVKDARHVIDTGVTAIKESSNDTDFIMSKINGNVSLPKSPFLSYIPAPVCELGDAELICELYPPLFNRTYGKFSGHRNTPYDKECAALPAMTRYKSVVYIAHDIGSLYSEYGMLCYRDYLTAALIEVLGYKPRLNVSLGASGRATTLHQKDKRRYSINLTYASPRSCGMAQVIDDILPIYDVKIELEVPEKALSVLLPLHGRSLDFEQTKDKISFVLPKLYCHETILIEY